MYMTCMSSMCLNIETHVLCLLKRHGIIVLTNNYVHAIASISSTLHFSPETNFDYILTALGYSYPSEVPSSSMAASVGPTAIDEGVLMSLISQVKEVLSHLGDGFIRVSWY